MLSAARVLMILAGILGLPSVACSAVCSSVLNASQAEQGGKDAYTILLYVSALASVGAVVVGATARRLGKVKSGVLCLVFACCYAGLVLQLNVLGVTSAVLLLIAAVMTFVASEQQFRDVMKVEVQANQRKAN